MVLAPPAPNATHLPMESRLMAMAEPMTSCMSEPMMASSTISHRMIRGACGEEHPRTLKMGTSLVPLRSGRGGRADPAAGVVSAPRPGCG